MGKPLLTGRGLYSNRLPWSSGSVREADAQLIETGGGQATAATSLNALDQLMAGLGGTTRSRAGDDDSDPLPGLVQDDVLIDLLFS